MAEAKTYRARERGYVDDRMVEAGETFTTSAPKGSWMALLDKDGNELDDPEPEPKVDELAAAKSEIADLKAKLAAFDGDGNGKPGGSKPAQK